MNAAEHIDSAKAEMARGKARDATAHALIAIAELLVPKPPVPRMPPPPIDWEGNGR